MQHHKEAFAVAKYATMAKADTVGQKYKSMGLSPPLANMDLWIPKLLEPARLPDSG